MSTSEIYRHYTEVWGEVPTAHTWTQGPVDELPLDFRVLEFKPSDRRDLWTYATENMSNTQFEPRIELYLLAPARANELVGVLTSIAHYHANGARLNLGHTVNLGRPWLPNSLCDRGLLSLPYLDGPALEQPKTKLARRVLWLVPITVEEVNYKKSKGLQALEDKFETAQFNYADPLRASVV